MKFHAGVEIHPILNVVAKQVTCVIKDKECACFAADAVVDKNIKNKLDCVGCDSCGIYVVFAGCRDCSLTVDVICEVIPFDFDSGCVSCCDLQERKEKEKKSDLSL